MSPRHLALSAFLAISPAHATLLEYSFDAQLGASGVDVVGPGIGDLISSGFLWGEAAPKIAHKLSERSSGTATATHDISNVLWWVILGDRTFTVWRDELAILYAPNSLADVWDVKMYGGYESEGHSVAGLKRTSSTSELQVPAAANSRRQAPKSIWTSWWGNLLAAGIVMGALFWCYPRKTAAKPA